ncbi:hypothetical protein CIPAW_04G192100 [Carya illinoinensis]|uniref:Uncharacterized protein n=1 Tax=Carya illinoinensis TaxID=32201 RepID=A0A8T1QWG7_CARIL|nr:hypothetical protein CIPAW_04G192100 [Carya illinoinensis]
MHSCQIGEKALSRSSISFALLTLWHIHYRDSQVSATNLMVVQGIVG